MSKRWCGGLMKALKVLLTFLGLLVTALSVTNALVGFGVDGEGVRFKIPLEVFPDCVEASSAGDDETINTLCRGSVGLFEGPDLIAAGSGLGLIFLSLLMGGGRKGKVRRAKREKQIKKRSRKARRKGAIGLVLVILAGADIVGVIQPFIDGDVNEGRRPIEYADLIGVELPGFIAGFIQYIFQLPVLLVGARLFIKSRRVLKETSRKQNLISMGAVESDESLNQAHAFRGRNSKAFKGKLETKGVDKFASVGDLRKSMNLDSYTDEFQLGMAEEDGEASGQMCHYCAGTGCGQCNDTGYL